MKDLKLFFICLISVLFLISIAFAQDIGDSQYQYEFTKYSISADVGVDKVAEEIVLTIKNIGPTPMTKVDYIVSGKVFDVKVSDSTGPLNYNITREEHSSIISCLFRKPIGTNEEYTLTIRFQTTSFIGRINENTFFKFTFTSPALIKNFTLSIKLPEYMWIVTPEKRTLPTGGLSVSPSLSPPDANIKTEANRFLIVWDYNNLPAGWEISPTVVFGPGAKPQFSLGPYEFIIFMVISFIAGSLIIYILFRFYYKVPTEERVDITLTVLKEDERKAIEAMLVAGGKMTQRELQDKTGFSKAKLSRLVFDLEKRGVLRKDREGRTNILMLSEDFYKPAKSEEKPKEIPKEELEKTPEEKKSPPE
ncbi:MAG: hypothetical protein HY929_01395 [Euryarchaeota archaeon]|nr:hypothetical protein [Euryarchaeota archaeon]